MDSFPDECRDGLICYGVHRREMRTTTVSFQPEAIRTQPLPCTGFDNTISSNFGDIDAEVRIATPNTDGIWSKAYAYKYYFGGPLK